MQNEATSFYKTRREPQVGSRPFALRRMTCCVMLACCDLALANPTAPQVLTGSAGFAAPNARTLHVTNAPGTIIKWDTFSVGAGEVTKFIQQSPSSAVLNRLVTGAPMSQIHGQLLSNGRVFLINPAGILVGATGVIDTAGFVGSTLNMTDADFLAGKLKFEGSASAGSIQNQGWIKAGQGGNIVLVAPTIENRDAGTPNSGVIQAEGGEIVLAAGRKVTIGSLKLEGVQFEVQAPTDSVLNLGKLLADDGAVGVFAGTLRHSGDIRANAFARDQAGQIVLKAQGDVTLAAGSTTQANGKTGGSITVQSGFGTTSVSGELSAIGSAGKGGDIQVLGERVGVFAPSVVDTSGERGGGQILIGGDYLGRNPSVRNATRTFAGAGTLLRADAGTSGDGGKIIVWSEEITRAYGSISARGGATAGNGGFVETSGKDILSVAGIRVDISAPAGRGGSWLLDPKNIIVGSGPGTLDDADAFADGGGTNTITVDAADISGVTGGTVTLQANNDISFNQAVDITTASAVALTAQAGRSINVNANVRVNNGTITLVGNDNTTAAGAGVQPANRDTDQVAAITMAPGTSLSAGGAITILMNNGGTRAGTPGADTGDITLANVTGTAVRVRHLGQTADSRIVRAADLAGVSPLITGSSSVFLQLDQPGGASASVGTHPQPIRVSTPAFEARTYNNANPITDTGALGGIYVSSPGALQIGGAVEGGTITVPARGVQTIGGPIEITAAGALTRTAADSDIASGSPLLAVPFGNITLNAASIGTAATPIRINPGTAQVAATATAGDIYLSKITGDATLAHFTFSAQPGRTVELGTLAGGLFVDVNVPLGGRDLILRAGGGNSVFLRGVGPATPATISADNLSLFGTSVVVDSATMNLDAQTTINAPLNVTGGTVNFNATSSINGGGTLLTLSSGTLGGSGTLTVNGDALWSGGGMTGSGETVITNSLTMDTGPKTFSQRTLRTQDDVTWSAGNVTASNGVSNGGSWIMEGSVFLTGDVQWASGGGARTLFDNQSGITRSTSGGLAALDHGVFGGIGGGAIDVQTGTLRLSSGVAATEASALGAVTVTGVALEFAGANNTVAGAITGTGNLAVSGGNLLANGAVTTSGSFTASDGTATFAANPTPFAPSSILVNGGTVTFDRAVNDLGTFTLSSGGARFNVDSTVAGAAAVSSGTLRSDAELDLNLGLTFTGGTITSGATPASVNVPGVLTISSGAPNLTGHLVAGTLDMTGGTLTIGTAGAFLLNGATGNVSNATVNNAGALSYQGGGSLQFAATATLNNSGNIDVPNGEILLASTNSFTDGSGLTGGGPGVGLIRVTNGGSFNGTITSDSLRLEGGAYSGTATFAGTTEWDAGIITGAFTVPAAATFNLIGTSSKTIANASLTTNGSGRIVFLGTGGLILTNGGNLTIDTGGTLDFQNNATITGVALGFPPGTVTNRGTINNTGTTGTSVIGGGDLSFTNASGVLNAAIGTTLQYSATNIFNGGTQFTGLGSNVVTTDSTFNGNITSDNLTLQSGAFAGTANLAGTTSWTDGTVTGAFIVPAGATLNLTGGGIKTVSGALASLTNDGTVTVAGPGGLVVTNSATLTTSNLFTWNGGPVSITLGAGSSFTNSAGGTLNLNANVFGTGVAGVGSLANAGILNSNPGVLTRISSPFANSGTVNVVSGVLQLTAPGAHTGAFTVDPGTTLEFGGGAHTLSAGGAIAGGGGIFVRAGSINATGPVTTTGPLTVSGGSATFEAAAAALTPSSVSLSGVGIANFNRRLINTGTFGLADTATASIGAPSTVAGTATIAGGTLSGAGTLEFGNDLTFIGGTISNTGGVSVPGTTTINAGTPQLSGLLSTGVLDASGGSTLAITSSGILILNGPGTSQIANATLNNAGTVRYATPGDDLLIGNNGVFSNEATGIFDIQGDLFVRGAGTGVFNNAGTVLKSGGTTAAGGFDATLPFNNNGGLLDSALGALELTGGGVHSGQFRTAGNGVNLNGGTHTFAAGSTIDGPFVFLNGGAVLDASGNPIVNSGLVWNGPSTITGGTLTFANPAVFNIVGIGTRILDNVTINNAGTTFYDIAADTLVMTNGAVFNNTGVTNVLSGTLRLAGGGADTGTYMVATSGELRFAGGTRNLNPGASITGTGPITVSGGVLNINTPMTIANPLTLTGGNGVTLGGNANVTLTGPFMWNQGADIRGTGRLITAGTTTISDAQDGIDKNWTNTGTVNMDGTAGLDFFNSASTITNQGTFNMASTLAAPISRFSGSGTFFNEGTFNKTGAGTQTIQDVAFVNAAGGILNVHAGTLAVPQMSDNAGVLKLLNNATFTTNGASINNVGTLAGNGTIDVGTTQTVFNDGLVAPGASPGAMTIAGNYTQGPNGVLAIEIDGTDPGVTYDVLRVTGVATLDGTLAATSALYTPSAGDSYAFMTYASRVGDFATFNFPAGSVLQPTPGATSYALFASATPIAPLFQDVVSQENQRLVEQLVDVLGSGSAENEPRGRSDLTCR